MENEKIKKVKEKILDAFDEEMISYDGKSIEESEMAMDWFIKKLKRIVDEGKEI